MKYSIGKLISKSIKEGKWLNITYKNTKGEITKYWITIKDINIEYKSFVVDIFNVFKGVDTLYDRTVYYENILEASVLDGTYYEVDPLLIEKIEKNVFNLKWLEYDNYNDSILDYYSDAKKLDIDPYQRDYGNVSGLDTKLLLNEKKVTLNDEQFERIAKDILNNQYSEEKMRFSQLAINKLSIYSKNREYVVAYYPLNLDVSNKELVITEELIINKTFLIDEMPYSLAYYLDISVDDFLELVNNDFDEAKERIRDNLRDYEKLDENPLIMLINRNINIDYDSVFDYIKDKHRSGELEIPLKAFFGEMSKKNMGRKEPNIVLIDKKVDIDQVRVVYNAMKNPVTYVQGPPGTGKTSTILNVILSSFLNEETCLVCSNNNHPIDSIIRSLKFDSKYGSVPFPIIRLGNRDELKKSINYIKRLIDRYSNIKILEKMLMELNYNAIAQYKDIKLLLSTYEAKRDLNSSLEDMHRFNEFIMNSKTSSSRLKRRISEQETEVIKKINSIPTITNDQIIDNVVSAKDDEKYMMYLYFNSCKYIKRLKEPKYDSLRLILDIKDDELRVNEFTRWIKNDNNFKLFQRVFPIIACTNMSAIKLGENNTYFDLCIMDEAGQCDVAASLVPISKARRLLLVGDTNQLQPVITIDSSVNDKLKKKYGINRNYDYCNNSIVRLMTNVDDISKNILLSYHYRCAKKIADFSNMRYYDNKLKIKTCDDGNQLEFIKVNNNSFDTYRNSYLSEASEVVSYIKDNNLDMNSVSIITPFRNQAYLINKLLEREKIDVKCGTIHTVQGSENSTIIVSPAIGVKSSKKTYEWLANNKELINVAVTRAKSKLVLIGDDEALDTLSNKEDEDDIISLKNYIKSNGSVKVGKSKVNVIEIGLSNSSECENELFETLTQFCSVHRYFNVRRNQPVNKVLDKVDNDELKDYFDKAEFDLVLYAKNIKGRLIPQCVIELNGGEHYISKSRSASNDKKKIEICKENKIKYLSLPNSYSKSYEIISNIIFGMSGEKDLEEYNIFKE